MFPRFLSRYAGLLVILCVMLLAARDSYWSLNRTLADWNQNPVPVPSWVGVEPGKQVGNEKTYDVDTHLIHGGLVQAPRFRDTLRWWIGTWAGQVPFYRPLTSMAFWAEWKLWGDREGRYGAAPVIVHILAAGALAALALEVFRTFEIPFRHLAALFAGYVFVMGGAILLTQEQINLETYASWINLPDCLSLLWFCLCLLFYLRDQEQRRVSVVPLIFYVLLCLTKEAGIFLPLVLPLLEIRDTRLTRENWRRMLPLLVALPVYLALRAIFLRDAIGFRYGSNHAWGFRLLQNTFGPISENLAGLRILQTVFALYVVGVLGLWLWRRHSKTPFHRFEPYMWIFLPPVGLVLTLATTQLVMQREFDVTGPVLMLLELSYRTEVIACTLFLIGVAVLIRNRPRLFLALYVWVMLAVGLTLFSPTMMHRYYIVNASYAIMLGAGFAFVLRDVVQSIPRKFPIQSLRLRS